MNPVAKKLLQLAATTTGWDPLAMTATVLMGCYAVLLLATATWQVYVAVVESKMILNILAAMVAVADCLGLLCHWFYARTKRYAKTCEICLVPGRQPHNLHVLDIVDWLCLGALISPLYGFSVAYFGATRLSAKFSPIFLIFRSFMCIFFTQRFMALNI